MGLWSSLSVPAATFPGFFGPGQTTPPSIVKSTPEGPKYLPESQSIVSWGGDRQMATGMSEDAIWATVWPQPWNRPGDLEEAGLRQQEANRFAFRMAYITEPSVRSAIGGKVDSIATRIVNVAAYDRKREEDEQCAEFVKWTLTKNMNGIHGIIRDILVGAYIDGWSVNEPVLHEVDRYENYEWAGFWGINYNHAKDTHHLALQLDQFRNIKGIVNLIRGVQKFEPQREMVYTHNPLFSNPFGHSDCETIIRAVNLINDAYKSWYIAIKRTGLPYFHGQYGSNNVVDKKALSEALEHLYAMGWAVTSEKDKIEVKNLASATSFQAFEAKVRILREDVFMGIRRTYMPFLEGQGGTLGSGPSKVHKVGSDAQEDMDALDIEVLLNRCLAPYLTRSNFGPHVGVPTISLGQADDEAIKKRMEVIKIVVEDLKLPVSKSQAYEESRTVAPLDDDDVLGGMQHEEKDNTTVVQAVAQLQAQVKQGAIDAPAARASLKLFFQLEDQDTLALIPDPPPQPVQPGMPGQAPGQPQQPAQLSQGQPQHKLVVAADGSSSWQPEPQTFSADSVPAWQRQVSDLLTKFEGSAA